MLNYFLESLNKTWPIIPVIIDELTALECVKYFSGTHITSLEECKTGNFSNIFFYEKAEDKKQFSIADTRRFLDEVSLQPYTEKALYILSGFDTASSEAMNASLKILEEPPAYAIILLVVENPECILETIHSRTIMLYHPQRREPLSRDISWMIRDFFSKHPDAFIAFLFEAKYDESMAIAILIESLIYTSWDSFHRYEQAIIDLFQVNENPRNILDRVFLMKKEKDNIPLMV